MVRSLGHGRFLRTTFKGYLAEVYVKEGDKDKVLSTIGIDVSSNWKRFPSLWVLV